MYGLPMSAKEIKFFRAIAGGRDPPTRPVREAWFCCGRGAGKDSIASAIIAHAAAMFDQQNILRPGEKAMVACLAVDREQARIVLDYTRGYFAEGEFSHDLIETENAQGFDLTNGVRSAMFTNSFRAVRGPSMKICVLDEVAFSGHSEKQRKTRSGNLQGIETRFGARPRLHADRHLLPLQEVRPDLFQVEAILRQERPGRSRDPSSFTDA